MAENPVDEKPEEGGPPVAESRGQKFAKRIGSTLANFKKSGEFFKEPVDEKLDPLNQLLQMYLNMLIELNTKVMNYFTNRKDKNDEEKNANAAKPEGPANEDNAPNPGEEAKPGQDANPGVPIAQPVQPGPNPVPVGIPVDIPVAGPAPDGVPVAQPVGGHNLIPDNLPVYEEALPAYEEEDLPAYEEEDLPAYEEIDAVPPAGAAPAADDVSPPPGAAPAAVVPANAAHFFAAVPDAHNPGADVENLPEIKAPPPPEPPEADVPDVKPPGPEG